MPLVWIARRLGLADPRDRVYGPDLMLKVLRGGIPHGLRHYFCGSTPEVLDLLVRTVRTQLPGVNIVGHKSPPFRELSLQEELLLMEDIKSRQTDIVWVGLGTPRQDIFVQRMVDLVPVTLVAVGAAFDFIAGTKRQAPRVFQRAGLEWLFRLATEPRRLWRRYLIGNLRFIAGVIAAPPQVGRRR